MYECMGVLVYEFMYVCMYVRMYTCAPVYECMSILVYEYQCVSIWVYECMSVLVYVRMHVCTHALVEVSHPRPSLRRCQCVLFSEVCTFVVRCPMTGVKNKNAANVHNSACSRYVVCVQMEGMHNQFSWFTDS